MKIENISREQIDWAIDVLNTCIYGGDVPITHLLATKALLSTVSIAAFDLAERVQHFEQEYIKAQSSAMVNAKLLEQANEALAAAVGENERLRSYAEPKLFAAASDVLDYWDTHGEMCEEAMDELTKAVAWWDGLPEVERVELPKYEGGK